MKINPFNYNRRLSNEVAIGTLKLGGKNPVRIQSMANTDTNDIENSVTQCLRIVEAGGELVRYTTQGTREAESLKIIHNQLRTRGFQTPLSADVHFNANVADLVAQYVEKVRINPGNYVKSVKRNTDENYTDEEYAEEFNNIKKRFVELLDICKKNKTAIRIGVNHGSLSERMMNRFGDTSQGMVQSCMEFLRICEEENFHNVVISMKTSNTVMMVQTVRLLVDEMERENMRYPLHLGVTEAGDGEDGRIKSAVGIGALLLDGIGDTIRVSLSEDPEFEIPVARTLVDHIGRQSEKSAKIEAKEYTPYSRYEYCRRETHQIKNIGGEQVPIVIATSNIDYSIPPDYILNNEKIIDKNGVSYPIYTVNDIQFLKNDVSELSFLNINFYDLNDDLLLFLKQKSNIVLLLRSETPNNIWEERAFFHTLQNAHCTQPVIICRKYAENNKEQLQIKSAADTGILFIDGFGDGLLLENEGEISDEELNSIAFGILQATRVRITKTEYISCPGCGRTLFNLQDSIAKVKAKTSHLKGLKIAIMGCIVNGPGEMADADYGYVGAGRGKVSLYKKKICVEKNISEEDAIEKLLNLIQKEDFFHP